jgi:hypothetical protein
MSDETVQAAAEYDDGVFCPCGVRLYADDRHTNPAPRFAEAPRFVYVCSGCGAMVAAGSPVEQHRPPPPPPPRQRGG